MIRPLSVLCGILTLLATPGCGNKGPLYLPEETPDKAAEVSTTAPPQPGTESRANDEE